MKYFAHIVTIIIWVVIAYVFASAVYNMSTSSKTDAQEFVNTEVKKSNVIYDRHEYILFEYGNRKSAYGAYSFNLEHKKDCNECKRLNSNN